VHWQLQEGSTRLPPISQKFDILDKDKDKDDGALSTSEFMAAFEAPKQ
jgi:hypothetical protein